MYSTSLVRPVSVWLVVPPTPLFAMSCQPPKAADPALNWYWCFVTPVGGVSQVSVTCVLPTAASKFVGSAGAVWATAGKASAQESARSAATASARAQPISERRATRGRAGPAGRPVADAAYV